MKKNITLILFFSLPLFVFAQQKTSSKYSFSKTISWCDEFDKDGMPDTSKWSFETGGGGFGNHEAEYYTNDSNAIIKNGVLNIIAKKENDGGMRYTSARMVTKNKVSFLYGRFEIRAKLAPGKGLWPAIWLLPVKDNYGSWPASGEVDIMEQVGYDPDSIHISTHTRDRNWMKGNQGTAVISVPSDTDSFHVYGIDWTPDEIIGFIDHKQVFNYPNINRGFGYYPFNKPFFMILNVAVGGDWGGKYGIDDSIFPTAMKVDYVRVYKML
jgi:beta-glucanase (GH16 family)